MDKITISLIALVVGVFLSILCFGNDFPAAGAIFGIGPIIFCFYAMLTGNNVKANEQAKFAIGCLFFFILFILLAVFFGLIDRIF